MGIYDWLLVAIALFFLISILAYIVPGMILRAIRDFKQKYGKGEGEADVEE